MRKDKEQARELRRQGKSYNEIKRLISVPVSTLSDWFKDKDWSIKIKALNDNTSPKNFSAHLQLMHSARAEHLSRRYEAVRSDAESLFQKYKTEPLFSAGLMLYMGEGTKCYKNRVSIANSDPVVIKIFLKFLKRYSQISPAKIKFWLISYPDLDEQICLDYWLNQLGLGRSHIYKTQVIQGKSKLRKLHYGVGNINICDTDLRVRIFEWLKLLSGELVQ